MLLIGKSQCDTHFSTLSRFINHASKLKKLENLDDVIESIVLGQEQANENNRLRNGRSQVKLFCFKLNPEVINKQLNRKLVLPEIPVLVIPNIKSYYNLHTNQNFEVKTSILSNTDKSYDLFIEPNESKVIQNANTVLKFKGPQLIKDKFLKVQKNLGNKEVFFKILAKKKSLFARTSLTTTPSSSQESSTSKTYYSNDLPVPHRCQERIDLNKKNEKENQHYENCLVIAKYSVNQIKTLTTKAVLDELFAHGHAKTLLMARKKPRNSDQSKEELILHYNKYHTGKKVNPSLPNTSKALA